MSRMLLSLTLLFVLFLPSCSQAPDTDPRIERVESYLDSLESAGFSGTVLVELDGERVISRGYGFRDRENDARNTPATVFDTGSITKQFTAAAILKLEMDGKLSVQDPLALYFPDAPDDKAGITIHDLLRHQSGLRSNVGKDFDRISEDEFVQLVLGSPLLFETGTSFGYSNIGYSLLGLIIERASGTSYEAYLYEQLWQPAGMESTGYTRPGFDPDRVAVGYYRDGRVWGRPSEKEWDEAAPYWHLAGNGGVLSSTEDLYRWHRALLGDDILPEEVRQKLYHPTIREDESPEAIYAYGWDVSTTSRDTRLVWHNGSNGFVYADFHRFIDEGVAVIMLSNMSHPNFNDLGRDVARIVFEPGYDPAIPHPDNEANREFTARILKTIAEASLEEATLAYENRSQGMELLEFQMRDAGFAHLFNTKEPELAVDVFSLTAMAFPESAPALRGLAEAYMETGQHGQTVEYFRRSLLIDPGNPFANEMIVKLQEEQERGR